MVEPIKPNEVVKIKGQLMPEEVITAFNEFIAKKWDGRKSVIKTEDVVNLILFHINRNRITEFTRQDIYDNKWLDVGDIFREAGWKVKFEKPDYTEDFPSYFEFSK